MSKALQARLALDLVMTIFLMCCFAYRIIGDSHEWIGVSFCVLFIAHTILNLRWYRNIFYGRYIIRRIVTTVINLLLIVTMATLVTTGLLHSRTVLAFLHLPGGMLLRQIHTTAAYWSLVLTAAHISLHWEMIFGMVQKMTGITSISRARVIMLRVFLALLMVYGLWAFWDRDMAAKLFRGYSFDFWDPERPAIVFFTSQLALLSLYIVSFHGLFTLILKLKRH